ncbi:MAG TPA: ABC transporter permease subunit [Thermomicrobiales bacterium]|nr:ABC transporter permease subunit [Thermomicrobiales bacterium]
MARAIAPRPCIMSATTATDAIRPAIAQNRRKVWLGRLTGPGLVLPAAVVTVLFSLVPIAYLVLVSLTHKSDFFFGKRDYSLANYDLVFNRYWQNVVVTIRLGLLASILNLVWGYPFAYILIRKVRYREVVRTFMAFPLFGPLYLAFGLYYILLPGGPLAGLLDFLHIKGTDLLYSEPMTLFGMALFTFPFMVMNVGAALSNVDPMLEEAAKTLGAKPWQVFLRVLFPLSRSGILAGFLMCFGWNIGVFIVPILLGGLAQQRVLSLILQQKAMAQFDYGLAAAMGMVLMFIAFAVTWLALKFSRGALGA